MHWAIYNKAGVGLEPSTGDSGDPYRRDSNRAGMEINALVLQPGKGKIRKIYIRREIQ